MERRPNYEDLSWFLDLRKNDQIDLNPPYQRRSVWTSKDRQFFLDTIFRNYPSPSIFLHKDRFDDGETIYHVVDGKQRLETVFLFIDNQIRIPKDFGDLALDGKRWKDLATEPALKKKLWDYIVPIEYIPDIEGVIVENVFDRLNRNNRRLERQELRHAKYDGWLISLSEAEEDKPEWGDWKVCTKARAKRMKDVQFISELLLVILEGTLLGFDQDEIDERYAHYEQPQDDNPLFNEEKVTEELERVKNYIGAMESANGCISELSKTFNALYTVWGLVVLYPERLPAPEEYAEKYAAFMTQVEELAVEKDLEKFLADKDAGEYAQPLQYLSNSRGASTDLTQRAARLDALAIGTTEP